MKTRFLTKLLSVILAVVTVFTTFAVSVSAADGDKGKYLKDVYIAYGETKEKAEQWLRDNGWEPLYDLNDGKTSKVMTNAVAVIGIKRTDNPSEAITDMAVMNMLGGYSFDDYEALVNEKKADINEFIMTFVPALEEYRDNYNGKGSAGGKKRAQMAHDILNKFYDGKDDEYAVNDTGKPLGDLLLNKTSTELGDAAYNALSADKKANTADLQQIILESSGPAVLIIEQALALATDTAETSWLDRLNGLSGEALVEHIAEYVPEAAGQDLAPSAAANLLASKFQDYAKKLAAYWSDIHEDIVWYENYCDENDLWQEEDEIYSSKIEPYFEALAEEDADRYLEDYNRFSRINTYYYALSDIEYAGVWGETLYDFFCPEDEYADYSNKKEYFAPLAAALSKGQRASLEFLNLSVLLRLGVSSDAVSEVDFPSVDTMFKDEKDKAVGSISIYSGINRAIFRKGVALTSKTLQQKALGNDPYGDIWDEGGIVDIISYSSFAVGAVSMVAGIGMFIRGAQATAASAASAAAAAAKAAEQIPKLEKALNLAKSMLNTSIVNANAAGAANTWQTQGIISLGMEKVHKAGMALDKAKTAANNTTGTISKLSTAGKWMMGIGGALMVLAAVMKAVQMYEYYNRTFTQIPVMIVDEADIVSYVTDENGKTVLGTDGKPKKIITFDQFAYYEVVKCNRQQVGLAKSAQGGVDRYVEWGCGDAADLNADIGTQWLAMYVNRSTAKGDPIIADSLTLRTGVQEKKNGKEATEAAKKPDGYTGALHMFGFENAQKLDDTQFCYREDNEGMYLYWKGDADAFPAATASAFNGGYMALTGIGGLALGIAGTALFTGRKRKKEEEEPTAA